ncbi:MAG TPA: group II intron reverse transcriptase/maturase, partial [Chloroflexota bacterium]|nr:group II intron reverse transcriptase/maturase [Chloroflexota bacterium]
MRELKLKGKSHDIPKRLVWDAWLKVKSNGGAAGADGVTIEQFEEDLSGNLYRLWNRMSSGSYHPGPVRAVEIPKKGKQGGIRVLGIPNVVDRVAMVAAATALEPSVEPVFHEDSYGYRPGRSPVDAVAVCRERCWKRDWVVDLDIRAFFTQLDQGWLERFLEHRIADKRILRLIQKWLRAGVIEDGEWSDTEAGTAQGASVSPLLSNVFLHYVFDLWADQWRRRKARGDVVLVRFADDFLAGFQHREDAERFLADLRERFAGFGLELHPDKTRLIEFGRYAAERRKARGDRKPETFEFLGFTHICAKDRHGRFKLKRVTSKEKM